MISIKQNRSWSKPDNVPGLIAIKKVDWSIFEYGSHIPLDFHEDFEEANSDIHIELGDGEDVELIIDSKKFNAKLVNIDRKQVDYDTYQLRYDSNNKLKEFLREKFKTSYNYLRTERDKEENLRKQHILPEYMSEYMEFYETGEPFRYGVKLITANHEVTNPFSRIFTCWKEAEWAFELLNYTCQKLDIRDMLDNRFSITLRNNKIRMHFYFCDWMILGFYTENNSLNVDIALSSDEVKNNLRVSYDFKDSIINSYSIPINDIESFEQQYKKKYTRALQEIKKRFENWNKTQFRKYNVSNIAKAIFDEEYRVKLLSEGIGEDLNMDVNIWWVNQGRLDKKKKDKSYLWAPIENQNGINIWHWDTMKEVEVEDIILHYSNGALKYVSKALSTAKEQSKPENLANNNNWSEMGRLIELDNYELDPIIELNKFNDQLKKLNITKGPINVKGEVNQGYLFKFSKEALTIIQQAQPETKWPEFALLDDNAYKEINVQATINNITKYISAQGFTYPAGLIENFYLSLRTKPFVLLAGVSGTGKTKLVKLFAEAIGCTESNDQFKLISVRPDWSDSSDLLGYKDIKGKFQPGPMIDILKKAKANPDYAYFVCLDEMNLARVEYYFSDFLSIMETRKKDEEGRIFTSYLLEERDFTNDEDKEEYAELIIPDNLYIVGTVNMDETTHPFSKKVLDRANTIEFSEINLMDYRLSDEEEDIDIENSRVNNQFLRANFLTLNNCSYADEDIIEEVVKKLQEINEILEQASLQVGYRVRDEFCFYMIYNQQGGLLKKDQAFDFQLMQKILPRIQGSSRSIKNVLIQLFNYTTDGALPLNEGEVSNDAIKIVEDYKDNKGDIKIDYPMSAEKIATMIKRIEEDGFTAYWL